MFVNYSEFNRYVKWFVSSPLIPSQTPFMCVCATIQPTTVVFLCHVLDVVVHLSGCFYFLDFPPTCKNLGGQLVCVVTF